PHIPARTKKSPTAARFMAVIGLIFGLSFGWFTGGQHWHWSLAGGLSGMMLGYLFGSAIDRSMKG
ncbi:MAG: SoxR reducing system RseC family protein, partial [Chitinophagaceae bacterium]|nr:SoxR reducing system RseC family protein [Chitinophagaceae bacterium]